MPSRRSPGSRGDRSTPTVLGLILVLLLGLPSTAQAQTRNPTGTLVSDRPGLADGTWVVAPGVLQGEFGATLQDTGADRIGIGSALVRWGFAPLELRIYLPSPLVSVEPDGTELGDLGLGVKVPLSFGDDWRWSAVGGATFPTGTDGGTADETAGFATLVGETSLTSLIGLTLNVGYTGAFESVDRGTLSVITTPTFPLSGTLSGYAGYAGFFDTGAGPDAHFLEAGIAGVSGPDLQWDLNSGWDVENDTWFVGIGLALRRR